MKQFEIFKTEEGKHNLIMWVNQESYIYIKKYVTLKELNKFKDMINQSITEYTKKEVGLR